MNLTVVILRIKKIDVFYLLFFYQIANAIEYIFYDMINFNFKLNVFYISLNGQLQTMKLTQQKHAILNTNIFILILIF